MGLLNRSDAKMFRSYFSEMCKLIGQSVAYQYITKRDMTIHSEDNNEFSTPIRIDALFDENPSIKTLNKIGWVSELNETKPLILNLPYNTPNLTVGARVTIETVDGVKRPRVFVITKIASDLEYPDAYTCIIAPVFDQTPQKNQYTLVNSEKINEDASERTGIDEDRLPANDTYVIDTIPQENKDCESTFEFIDDSNSPYSG